MVDGKPETRTYEHHFPDAPYGVTWLHDISRMFSLVEQTCSARHAPKAGEQSMFHYTTSEGERLLYFVTMTNGGLSSSTQTRILPSRPRQSARGARS